MFRRKPEALDPALLLHAYSKGIFPMADEYGRIQWYAPDPRAILEHDKLSISRSLRSTLRKRPYTIRMDSAFELVMRSCADREETWINEEFIKTYTALHFAGIAHSIEAWRGPDLLGGIYGIALGGAFMGESMFSRATDASKVCLVALVHHLQARSFTLHDTQFLTPHLATLGVHEISRHEYERRLQSAIQLPCTW